MGQKIFRKQNKMCLVPFFQRKMIVSSVLLSCHCHFIILQVAVAWYLKLTKWSFDIKTIQELTSSCLQNQLVGFDCKREVEEVLFPVYTREITVLNVRVGWGKVRCFSLRKEVYNLASTIMTFSKSMACWKVLDQKLQFPGQLTLCKQLTPQIFLLWSHV